MPNFTLTDSQQQALLDAARQARGRAYAPYSNYPVGAAVLDESGRIHAGCNVENAAYPEGLCAEAAALSAMVLAGGRQGRATSRAAKAPARTPHERH
jgi:cytidine deaminase